MSVGILSKWGHFLAKFARDALLRDVLLESGQKKNQRRVISEKAFYTKLLWNPRTKYEIDIVYKEKILVLS